MKNRKTAQSEPGSEVPRVGGPFWCSYLDHCNLRFFSCSAETSDVFLFFRHTGFIKFAALAHCTRTYDFSFGAGTSEVQSRLSANCCLWLIVCFAGFVVVVVVVCCCCLFFYCFFFFINIIGCYFCGFCLCARLCFLLWSLHLHSFPRCKFINACPWKLLRLPC